MDASVVVADSPGQIYAWPIADVAAMTHISKRRILDACRAGQLEHIKAGGRRVMTRPQIDALLAKFKMPVEVRPEPADDMAEAIRLSRRNANRQTPRRAGR